jgi:hypothetical protein
MKLKDISTVYHLGNSIFTASEFPNMYRTWDDFTVLENFGGNPEFCFVAETETAENASQVIPNEQIIQLHHARLIVKSPVLGSLCSYWYRQ